MRPPLLPLALTFGLLGSALTEGRASDFVLFKNTWGNVIVATDTTPAGRKLTPPTKAQPVYYKGISLGRKLGSIAGDREPGIEQLNQFVGEVLAKQGYLPAQPGDQEPALLLVIQWGVLDPRQRSDLVWFLGYNPDKDIAAATMITEPGPEVLLYSFRSAEIVTILQDASNPLYGVIVTAFDYQTAKTPNPVAYWQTRIGLPAHGKSMSAALPVMIATAGPAIGRPADAPVLLDSDNIRNGEVKLGELKFLETDSGSPRAEDTGAKK